MDDFNKALELDPNLAQAYYNRGRAYQALGDREKAIADFQKVLEISQDADLRQRAQQHLDELRVK